MSKVIIVTDSASDISEQDEKQHGIKILSFKVSFGEKSYVSRVDFTNKDFYQMMAESPDIPMTSQLTPFEFVEFYKELSQQGYTDVIMTLINSEGSATFGNANMAKDMFYSDFPQAADKMKIHIIDGRSYTCAYGYPVVEAAKMLQDGKEAEEIVEFLKDWTEHSMIYAGLYTLKYAAKSGRISGAAAFVGDKIGMKPIMRICDNHITTGDKVRGEKNIIPFIVKKTLENIEPGSPYVIVYGDDDEIRQAMAQEAEKALGYPPAAMWQIGAEISANAGPRVVGACFKRK